MNTKNLSTLKIHKLTQAQYERELAAGRIDENALYLTPDDNYSNEDIDTILAGKSDTSHIHDNASTENDGFMSSGMVVKLDGIDTEANKTIVDDSLDNDSTNPVQNKIITSEINTLNSNLDGFKDDVASTVSAIQTLINTNTASIDELKTTTETQSASIGIINTNVSNLQNEIETKVNKQELEWATYNESSNLAIQVPNSSFKVMLDDAAITLSQGENTATFKDNTFTSEKLVANASLSVGGLVFVDEGDAGFSIM